MPIDTYIEGNPESVRSVAGWLRSTLAGKVSQTVDQIHNARITASSEWNGDAGSAFVSRMATGASKAEGLETVIRDSAQAIDHFAGELQHAQSQMQSVRDNAAGAGLTVSGFVIQDPTSEEQITDYITALNAADAARDIEKLAADTVKNVWADSPTNGSSWWATLSTVPRAAYWRHVRQP